MKKSRRNPPQHNEKKIRDSVLRFLSFRPRSIHEVEVYLKKRLNVDDDDQCARLISELKRLHFLDDTAFVQWWIERRRGRNPKGAHVIRIELRQKGIANDLIDVFFEADAAGGEIERARRALEKKLPVYAKLPPKEYRRKAGAFLARRGFDWETIQEVLFRLTAG